MTTVQSVIARAVVAQLNQTTESLNATILNLSGGVRTNAGVADFSVGTILQSRSGALTIANINAGQAKSLLQTAKGGLDEILTLVQSIKTLAVQASDASLTDNERANLNLEAQTLITELDRLATTTTFNNRTLLDGSISGTASLTSQTGQAVENYTLLTTSDFSFSGTTAAGELDATADETFAVVESDTIGKTAGTTTIVFTSGALTAGGATLTIGGTALAFGASAADATALATDFVAQARASTDDDIRKFIYSSSGATVTITAADLGTAANTVSFQLTGTDGGNVTAATFGGETIIGSAETINSSLTGTSTAGSVRTVATADKTLDAGLEGAFSNFTAALDTTDYQNKVTFTVDVNGTTYTSNAVTLFGTGGFNGKGAILKNGQVLTFYNTEGPTNALGEYTDNGFTLKIDDALGTTDDITIAGGTQDAFETDLTNTAAGFLSQLSANRINQSRDIILPQVNATGADFDVSAAVGTTFAGIEGYDSIGTDAKGNISFVGDTFGDDGRIGNIGSFSYNASTHTISTTIDGETYSADISDTTANTGGLVAGAGNYNTTTRTLTVGAGTILVFNSASTSDGKQLRLDLSNLTDTNIELDTAGNQTTFTDDLDTLFAVSDNNSLSFQVGYESSNTIGVSLSSSKTTDIFLDDAGTYQAIDISTTTGAAQAQEVLDNALNNVLGLIATTQAGISSFTAAITTNNVQVTNFDAASSALLNTDYSLESTLYAQYSLQIAGSISVLAQEQSRLQNILKLLS